LAAMDFNSSSYDGCCPTVPALVCWKNAPRGRMPADRLDSLLLACRCVSGLHGHRNADGCQRRPHLAGFPTYAQAEAAGALLIRQDVRLLEQMVKLGVDGALRLIEEGVLVNQDIDHFLCHYSSHHFRGKIADLLVMSGAKHS